MKGKPVVTRVELHEFEHELKDVGKDLGFALGPFYEPGSTVKRHAVAVRIHTDVGVTGEYVSIAPATSPSPGTLFKSECARHRADPSWFGYEINTRSEPFYGL